MKSDKKQERAVRIGHIGVVILGVLAVGTFITTAALFPGVAHIIAPFVRKKKYSPQQAIKRNLETFIRLGLVRSVTTPNGEPALRLTKKGTWEAMLRHGTLPTFTKENPKWDSVWRVVIFDVPNKKNRKRNDLRRAMLMYGFKPIQKSAWVYPYECDGFIALLKSHLGITSDVLYMKVSFIENDRHLRKEFNL